MLGRSHAGKAIPFYPELLIPGQGKNWRVHDTTSDPYRAWVNIYAAEACLVYPYVEELQHILRHENAHVGYTRAIEDFDPHFARESDYWRLAKSGFEELRVNAISFSKGLDTGLAWDLLGADSLPVKHLDIGTIVLFFESFAYRYPVARRGKDLPKVLCNLQRDLDTIFGNPSFADYYRLMNEAGESVWNTPTIERVVYWTKRLIDGAAKLGLVSRPQLEQLLTPLPSPGEGPPGKDGELTEQETDARPIDGSTKENAGDITCNWDKNLDPNARKKIEAAAKEAYEKFLRDLESSGGFGSPNSPEIDLEICTKGLGTASKKIDNYGGIRPRSRGGIPGPTMIGTRWGLGKTIFAAPARRGMSVCIDGSGSMSWNPEDLEAIVREIPAANIFVYSGEMGRGHICWLVRNGKGATEIPKEPGEKGLYGYHRPGDNVCDLEALSILGSLQGPRIWLSDGQVCGGVINDPSELYRLCQQVMDRRRIVRVLNIGDMRQLLKGEKINVRLSVAGDGYNWRREGTLVAKLMSLDELPR